MTVQSLEGDRMSAEDIEFQKLGFGV